MKTIAEKEAQLAKYDYVVKARDPKVNPEHPGCWMLIDDIARQNGVGIQGEDVQGFLDNHGDFVNREDALGIALAARQVLDVNNIRAGRLFSEDLW